MIIDISILFNSHKIGCSGVLDLMIVLDASGSIRSERFKYVENMTLAIIRELEIAQDKTRVGVIIYSDQALIAIRLNQFYKRQVGGG